MCAQVATRKGTARSYHHAQLVHQQWLHAAVHGILLWVKRVATDDKIADLRSRLDFRLLSAMGAREVEPKLDNAYMCAAMCEVLQLKWQS